MYVNTDGKYPLTFEECIFRSDQLIRDDGNTICVLMNLTSEQHMFALSSFASTTALSVQKRTFLYWAQTLKYGMRGEIYKRIA
jgi:hypothetical protein